MHSRNETSGKKLALMRQLLSLALLICPFALTSMAQEAREASAAKTDGGASSEEAEEALAVLEPFFESLKKARSTRATVELTAETIIDGAIVGTQASTYQIASTTPDQFTVYLRDDNQRTRLFSNGQKTTLALSPTAYTHLDEVIKMQDAVFGLPFALGPYPEVVLASTLAGVDPALTLANGMKSLKLVDRGKFRGKTPAIHVHGVQDDDVSWDFWLTQDETPKPLRLQVDLTEMLRANGELELPSGYKYLLRFDYSAWRTNLTNDPALFRYVKLKNAKEYDSIQAYAEAQRQTEAEGDK
ncbi:MAG: DUF2092 domain-containing protein [Planctomycetota bacterium]